MGIRLSSNQFVYNYKISLNEAYGKQAKLMEQADGSKIHRPSDNAVDYAKLLRYNVSSSENSQYKTNVQTALSWMKTADASATRIVEIQKTIKEKVIAAANDTNNELDMTAIGLEIKAGIQEIVALGNSQVGDRYVFSGQADLIQPYTLSEGEALKRGLAKTLDDNQKAFFSDVDTASGISQMLTLYDDENNAYYLNTLTGDVYSEEFVERGYKDNVARGQTTVDPENDRVASLSCKPQYDGYGNIIGYTGTQHKVATPSSRSADGGTTKYVNFTDEKIKTYFKSTGELTAAGEEERFYTEDGLTLRFAYVEQQIVSYSGDEKKIDMVKLNGAVDPNSDTVNMTGQELFGSDIFDDANSGYSVPSGVASLNNVLGVYQKIYGHLVSSDREWLRTDGITLADQAHSVTVEAQTRIAARAQLYENVTDMLTTQGENITKDITDVSSTDVGELAMNLMEQQTLYNLALSLGARVIPQSLADYL